MKIFDCFTFNDELEILKLRLELLYDFVDYFILVEARQTHMGNDKSLFFLNSYDKFKKWNDKILHFECPVNSELKGWKFEHYQREYIKNCLENKVCHDTDIVFISDVDEIVNISYVLKKTHQFPFRIEMPFFYYFTNLKASENWTMNICARWHDLKNVYIGDRTHYSALFPLILRNEDGMNGGHFSYLFGYSVDRYRNKIESFAHAEFNSFYIKNKLRLIYCIENKIDIYERGWIHLELDECLSFEYANKNGTRVNILQKMKYYPLVKNKTERVVILCYLFVLKVIYKLFLKIKMQIK